MSNPQSVRRKIQLWIQAPSQVGGSPDRWLLLKVVPARGGGWQPVTGWADGEEPLEATVMRELREETGFELVPFHPVGFEFDFVGRWGAACESVFVAKLASAEKPVLDHREHTAFEWVSADEVRKRLEYPKMLEAFECVLQRRAN